MHRGNWTIGTLVLSAVCAAALAADPPYYTRKGTWQETIRASREALATHEAEQAKKAELAAPAKPAKPVEPVKVGKLQFGPFYQIGPFTEQGKDAFDYAFPPEAFPPEKEPNLTAGYGKLRWQQVPEGDGQVRKLSCPGNGAIYFYRKITAARNQRPMTYYGSDDGLAVWCNGKKIISNKVPRGVSENQDKARLELKKGENHLLIKIWNQGGDCGWYFSATGKVRAGRKAAPDPRTIAREQLWDLVRRDFAAPEARRQMDWEREDNIWLADWTADSAAELARRYAGPARHAGRHRDRLPRQGRQGSRRSGEGPNALLPGQARAGDACQAQGPELPGRPPRRGGPDRHVRGGISEGPGVSPPAG